MEINMGTIYEKAKSLSITSPSSLYERAKNIASGKIETQEPTIEQTIPKSLDIFPSTIQTLSELQIDPLSLKSKPKEVLNKAWEALKSPVIEAGKDIKDLFTTATTRPKIIGKELEIAADIGGIVFSPISALFEGANKIPVLGSVSKLISLPFIAAGEGGAKIGKEIVNKLPISDENKESINQGVQEIFSLGSQLVLGKIIHITEKKVKELQKRFGEKDTQIIIDKANELSKQANEPVPPEMIKKEPTPIDISKVPPTMKMGELREAAIQRGFEVPEFGKEVVEPKPKGKYVEVPREQLPVKPIEGMDFEMEKRVSGLEARMKGIFETNVEKAKVEAEARGLDISVYDKMNKAEQLRMAAKFVERTPQFEVLDVLKGEKPAPKGLLNNAIMLALEEKSLRDKNVDLAIKLASLRSTRMGQEISILTEVGGLSPVSGMDVIIRARREVATKKLKYGETLKIKKETSIKEISTEQKKFQLKLSEVDKLLNEITC